MVRKISSGKHQPAAASHNLTEELTSPSILSNWFGIIVTLVLIFMLTLAGSSDNIIEKWTGLISAIIIIFLLFTSKRTAVFKNNITPLFFSVTAYIIWGGISTFYAASGKFAIFEFSKLLVALCVYLFVLFYTNSNESGFKRISYIFSTIGCFFGIISIDAASTGILSGIFKSFFGLFTEAFQQNGVFEQGIRITSIIGNPNIYSGFMAIAVLLSLYLVIHASDKRNSMIATSLLAVNALSYLLAFSMGSLFMFLLACLIMLGMTEKGNRISLFLLMSETAVLAFIFAFISMTGLGKAGFISLTPILALVLNAFCLYHLDARLRSNLNKKMDVNAKLLLRTALVIVIVVIGYTIAAFQISSDLTMNANESVMRAIYIPGGDYNLETESSSPIILSIESQNQYDLMRRTSTLLYSGSNDQPVTFTVPNDAKIVKVTLISSTDKIKIFKAIYSGAADGTIHLKYPLLPGIIANRVQDLFANENLVQRTIFFNDGMKLFSKSPVMGRGLGGFENGIYSVQDFFYETKYAHNHYIQVLSDLGIIGFILYISILVFSIVSIIKSRIKSRSLYAVPVLAACTFQIFGQAIVDAIWSSGIFLGFSAAVLALINIFCTEPIKFKESFNKNAVRIAQKTVIAVFSGIFILLLSSNLYAQAQAKDGVKNFGEIERYILMDRFEYNDYKLSYLINASQSDDPEVQKKAEAYANDLVKVESNSLAPYIVAYNFETYLDFDAFEAAKKGIANTKSYPNAWIRMFDTFEEYIDPVGAHMDDAAERLKGPKYYIDSVLDLYDALLERNNNSLDDIMLTPYNNAFIGKLLEIRATHLYSIDWVFTAIMTYAFDSECAVDANQDGLPDAMTVLSGNAQGGDSGIISVIDNTVVDLNLYHKLGGKYTFKIKTKTPLGIKISLNGQDQSVTYTDNSAYVQVDLADNSEMSISKFTVTFPGAADIDAITFITELE